MGFSVLTSRTRRPHVPSSPLTFSGSVTLWVFKILNDRRNFPAHNFTNLSNISLKFTFVWCTCIQESWTKLSLLTSHKFWRNRSFSSTSGDFCKNRRCADHSVVRPLHYADDVTACLGSTISEIGVLHFNERAVDKLYRDYVIRRCALAGKQNPCSTNSQARTPVTSSA